MRLADDRRTEEPAEYTRIRDRKRSAGDFVRAKFFRPCTISKIIRRECKSGERQRVGLLDHRNDQSPIERHRHPEIDVTLVDDVLAIDLGIHDREFADRVVYGLEDER